MNYACVLLCLSALIICGCASKRETTPSAPAAQRQSASAQLPAKDAAPPEPAAGAAPQSSIAVLTPVTQFSPVSGLPMSPADAVKIIEPGQAPHVGGGWGRNSDEAVVFRRGDVYYNYIMLEHFLLIARNRMFTTLERGEEHVVLNDRLRFTRSTVDKNKRKYDHWQYSFIIAKKTDLDRARAIVESSMQGAEKEKRLKEFTETFTQEFWFDVTEVFSQRSEELFKGLGKKGK